MDMCTSSYQKHSILKLPDFNGHAELVAGATDGLDGRCRSARMLQAVVFGFAEGRHNHGFVIRYINYVQRTMQLQGNPVQLVGLGGRHMGANSP